MASIQPPTPTPASIAARYGTAVPGGHRVAAAAPAPAAVPVRPPYDRHLWGTAVLASDLHLNDRLIALVLAHHAGPSGHLPAHGPQRIGRLSRESGISENGTRRALNQLETAGFLQRPDIRGWNTAIVRPVTLTLPPTPPQAAGEGSGVRGEPDHPGQAAS